MIGLTNTAKDAMLSLFAGKVFSLALFSGDEEIADAIYSRREVQFGSPVGEDVRYVENLDKVLFEGFNGTHLVDHWAVVDLNGTLLARYRLVEPLEVSSQMDCKFRPGELRIGLP